MTIQNGMKYVAMDNSGAHDVNCIKVFRSSIIKPASLLVVVVKTGTFTKTKKLHKGDVCKAVIVRLRKKTNRIFGYCVSYDLNGIILLKKNELIPLGTRVRGSIFFELQKFGFTRIVSLASTLV
jgi:ribosomal protein L14